MLIDENLQASGKLKITKIKADGTTEISLHKNLIVNVGLNYIAQRMLDAGTAPGHVVPGEMSHMQIGEGTAAPTAGNTQLLDASPSAGSRQPFTSVAITTNSITYEATFQPGQGTGALVEAGIFNSPTAGAGTMLCRTLYPIVTKESGDTITVQWTVTIAAA